MALPVKGPDVGNALFDVIFKGSYVTHDSDIRTNIMEWINAVGLVLSALPVRSDCHFRLEAMARCVVFFGRSLYLCIAANHTGV